MSGPLRDVLAALVSALPIALAAAASEPPHPRPNIVVLLADDLGWGDVGYHGSEIQTPQIDRLAAAGTRLNQFYVLPFCSPTRASLLTGRYPIRYGMQAGAYELPTSERTLAQALQAVGYRTAIAGKWHLGHLEPGLLPLERGFDRQYGHFAGAIDYVSHELEGRLDWHRNQQPLREEGYSTDLIADEAVRVIREHDGEKPFFLYVAFNAPHTPLAWPPGQREQDLGIANPRRRRFAAVVSALDRAIGRIATAIDEEGIREQTVLFFASDNGANEGVGGGNGPFRGGKMTLFEGGVRVPALVRWPGAIGAGRALDAPTHIVDIHATLLRLAGGTARRDQPLDGIDLWPALAGGDPLPDREILLNLNSSWNAIRSGEWKLIVRHPRTARGAGASQRRRAAAGLIELFHLGRDPSEQHNVLVHHWDVAARLMAKLAVFSAQAVPARLPGSGEPEAGL